MSILDLAILAFASSMWDERAIRWGCPVENKVGQRTQKQDGTQHASF